MELNPSICFAFLFTSVLRTQAVQVTRASVARAVDEFETQYLEVDGGSWQSVGIGICIDPDTAKLFRGRVGTLVNCMRKCIAQSQCGAIAFGPVGLDGSWCIGLVESSNCTEPRLNNKFLTYRLTGTTSLDRDGTAAVRVNRPTALPSSRDEVAASMQKFGPGCCRFDDMPYNASDEGDITESECLSICSQGTGCIAADLRRFNETDASGACFTFWGGEETSRHLVTECHELDDLAACWRKTPSSAAPLSLSNEHHCLAASRGCSNRGAHKCCPGNFCNSAVVGPNNEPGRCEQSVEAPEDECVKLLGACSTGWNLLCCSGNICDMSTPHKQGPGTCVELDGFTSHASYAVPETLLRNLYDESPMDEDAGAHLESSYQQTIKELIDWNPLDVFATSMTSPQATSLEEALNVSEQALYDSVIVSAQ